MPLSYYPDKTDEQLLRGLSALDPSQLAHLSEEQMAEFNAWLDSPNVKAIRARNERAYLWGMWYVVWVKLNLLLAFVYIMAFKPVPLNGVDPMHFIGIWLTVASLMAILAPVKAKKWWVWAAFVMITAVAVAMSGIF